MHLKLELELGNKTLKDITKLDLENLKNTTIKKGLSRFQSFQHL
jgi:hypothetical protein